MGGIEWYPGKRRELDDDIRRALEMTAEAVRTDLVTSGTVPYAEDSDENRSRGVVPGELQGSIFVDCSRSSSGTVSVVSNTPYARRLYYHPEYSFYQGANPQAGGLWYAAYLPRGAKQHLARRAFARFLRKARG